ncbi:MAG: NAD(P)H-quinone oxidoreductase subunit M [Chitinophagaceae bacterium]|jgi:NAD(P)H-quinone oxidoreductase subunit M|nr:NAD(P)H-quinone oxidoreductase subunit M [Chitinophagaceae bacterium]
MAESSLETAVGSGAAADTDTGAGFTLLKCTTRHVRLFTARLEHDNLVADPGQLTLDLDPDSEFLWDDAVLSRVQDRFRALVQAQAGAVLNDYSLRRIGSELEGEIRQLLQAGELRYNPDCRVQNFSMGLPRTPDLL